MFFFHFLVRVDLVFLYGTKHDVEPPPPPPLYLINEFKQQQNINIFQEFINPFTPSFLLTQNISRP